jgi:hypothetical protein
MSKKYPMTYEEYEKRVIELFLDLYPKDKQEIAMERINDLLKEEPEFIEALYGDTCFRYDHPEIYSETCKKVFEDYLLNSIPVHTLNLLLGGKVD